MNKLVLPAFAAGLLIFASLDGCVSDETLPITDSGTDATTPDAANDQATTNDVVVTDSNNDAVVDAAKIAEIYLVASTGFQTPQTSIEVIDIAQKKAVRDAQLSNIVALAFRNGSLYAVRGGGQSRISVVDPVTLQVTSTITLAWDPTGGVFSADGTTAYIARGAGFIEQIKIPAGSLTGEVQVPAPQGGTIQLATGMSLNNAETQLGLTFTTGGLANNVATVNISGASLTVGHNIVPPPIDGSNCGRSNGQTAYTLDDSRLATWDTNCGTVDVYMAGTLVRDDTASAQFVRPNGGAAGAILYDAYQQAWAVNYDTYYRVPLNNTPNKTAFPSTTLFWSTLFANPTRTTVWAVTYDPHNSGIFTIALDAGSTTQQLWDLSLVPQNANITAAIYVER